jgi:FkbM family methyltransferase
MSGLFCFSPVHELTCLQLYFHLFFYLPCFPFLSQLPNHTVYRTVTRICIKLCVSMNTTSTVTRQNVKSWQQPAVLALTAFVLVSIVVLFAKRFLIEQAVQSYTLEATPDSQDLMKSVARDVQHLQASVNKLSSTVNAIRNSLSLSPLSAPITLAGPGPGLDNVAVAATVSDTTLEGLFTTPLVPGQPGQCHFHSQRGGKQDRAVFLFMGGKIDTSSCKRRHIKAQSGWISEAQLCDCVAPSAQHFNLHFLEIGANDGQYLSNSLFFETQMGWTGVCVEAAPLAFKFLKENRPRCHNVHAVIGHEVDGKEVEFFTFLSKKSSSWETGLSCMKGFAHCKTEAGARKFAKAKNLDLVSSMVRGTTLAKVFHDAAMSEFGFWSIDVEGAEDIVLPTIDMTVAQADIVCYEGSPSLHPLSHRTLVEHGYERFKAPQASSLDSFYRPVSRN